MIMSVCPPQDNPLSPYKSMYLVTRPIFDTIMRQLKGVDQNSLNQLNPNANIIPTLSKTPEETTTPQPAPVPVPEGEEEGHITQEKPDDNAEVRATVNDATTNVEADPNVETHPNTDATHANAVGDDDNDSVLGTPGAVPAAVVAATKGKKRGKKHHQPHIVNIKSVPSQLLTQKKYKSSPKRKSPQEEKEEKEERLEAMAKQIPLPPEERSPLQSPSPDPVPPDVQEHPPKSRSASPVFHTVMERRLQEQEQDSPRATTNTTRIDASKNQHKCALCGQVFKAELNLYKHVTAMHPESGLAEKMILDRAKQVKSTKKTIGVGQRRHINQDPVPTSLTSVKGTSRSSGGRGGSVVRGGSARTRGFGIGSGRSGRDASKVASKTSMPSSSSASGSTRRASRATSARGKLKVTVVPGKGKKAGPQPAIIKDLNKARKTTAGKKRVSSQKMGPNKYRKVESNKSGNTKPAEVDSESDDSVVETPRKRKSASSYPTWTF